MAATLSGDVYRRLLFERPGELAVGGSATDAATGGDIPSSILAFRIHGELLSIELFPLRQAQAPQVAGARSDLILVVSTTFCLVRWKKLGLLVCSLEHCALRYMTRSSSSYCTIFLRPSFSRGRLRRSSRSTKLFYGQSLGSAFFTISRCTFWASTR